ncbi:methyl-accepting chemotaxis protein [Bradyrhizobium sp.]|uniref:methyl-accepting chemotaxis protein n=1 Tax=Bradyrhizobium sp. TaxID=376 RepID=UPI001DD0E282|nr:methyl-accepting chemotaxis protein [Bradyrhizobium sp.]MBI5317964.1 CZB domain-containing protein [Bradyrhizobium sp.]
MSLLSSVSQALRQHSSTHLDANAALTAELATLHQRDERLIEFVRALARGDLQGPAPDGDDALSQACRDLVTQIKEMTSARLDRTVDISIQGNETAISAARLLSASREIDSSTQALASASEEMVASIGQIRATAAGAASNAAEMRVSAVHGRTTVDSAVTTMKRVGQTAHQASERISALSQASEAIGSMVSSIDAIARQTNLLALNATIEAARAGDAGRGFAVVATEVKSLSHQTSKATEDITALIAKLRAEINAIVEAMAECTKASVESEGVVAVLGDAMAGVETHVAGVTTGMEEISGILNQQAGAVREIAEGITGIAAKTRQSVDQVVGISGQLDLAQGHVGRELQELSELSFEGKIVRLAKADHVIWKKRLADMAVGRVTLKADELADHHSCRLGKWYYGDGSNGLRDRPAFRNLETPHELVHRHGKRAAALFATGDLPGALAEIEKVDAASRDVVALLNELSR